MVPPLQGFTLSVHDSHPSPSPAAPRPLQLFAALAAAHRAGAVLPGDPDLAAVAGAPDGEQRAPGTADRRHAVGRADHPFPAGPRRRKPARPGRRDQRRPPAAGPDARTPGAPAEERPRTAARDLAAVG